MTRETLVPARIAVMFMAVIAAVSILAAGGAVAAETTETVTMNNTDVSNASSLNVTYDIAGINASNPQVISHDETNNTATLQADFNGSTVNHSISYSDGDETATVDLTGSSDWPPTVSGDTTDVTFDQSVNKVQVDGETVFGGTLLGSAIDGTSNSTLFVLAAVVVAVLYFRD